MSLLEGLNKEQKEAVRHDGGPLLVVAGAGTGKTSVITRRIAYLIEQKKARPEEILALTFTDKASREMEERVDQLVPLGTLSTKIMTFHAFGDLLLRQYGLEIGLSLNYTVMSAAQQVVWLRQNIDQLDLEHFAPLGRPDSYLGALAAYFARLKDELVSPDGYANYAKGQAKTAKSPEDKVEAAKQVELANAYAVYCRQTRAAGLIDFGDQIQLVLELFARRPNVLKQVRAEVRYILVDEFQDTNLAQNRLLQVLAGKNGNLMVVGDDDQSIYKFRGAAVSNILAFTKHYPSAKQIVLRQNYRSRQPVLDSAYRLIQHNNPDRLEVQNGINKGLEGLGEGPQPDLVTAPTYSLEADTVAAQIKQMVADGQTGGEIAILIRKHSQASLVTGALQAQGISYHYSGVSSLYEEPEVLVLLYFLQYIVDPSDSLSLYHLLAGEAYGLHLKPLLLIAARARRQNQTLDEALKGFNSGEQTFDAAVKKFFNLADNLRAASSQLSVGRLAYRFMTESGYLDNLTEGSRQNPALEVKVRNLGRFFSLLADYERVAGDRSALGYVLNLQALREAGDGAQTESTEPGGGDVQVMTVHQAKGLEFETVFIFNLTKGNFPAQRRAEPLGIAPALLAAETLPAGDWHLQEERRLMYVAMTRARTNLVMTYSPDHGGKTNRQPSPFIREALGVTPPPPAGKRVDTALQQIGLFEGAGQAAWVPANFMSGEQLVLTPHQIDDYLTCPANFRYRYILQVPQPPDPNLMYGNLIHAVIQAYFAQKQNGKAALDQLLGMVDELWSSEGFISQGQEQRRRGQAGQTIKRFYAREEAAARLPQHTEKSFSFELPRPRVIVRGRFDAVYDTPDLAEIRDFKTSQVSDQVKADQKAKTSVQLAIYALAWQKLAGRVPDRVVLDYVETGVVGTAVKTAKDLAALEGQIAKVADGIRSGQFEPSGNCRYCSHKAVSRLTAQA